MPGKKGTPMSGDKRKRQESNPTPTQVAAVVASPSSFFEKKTPAKADPVADQVTPVRKSATVAGIGSSTTKKATPASASAKKVAATPGSAAKKTPTVASSAKKAPASTEDAEEEGDMFSALTSSNAKGGKKAGKNGEPDLPELLDGEEKDDDSFRSIGLCPELAKACNEAGWKHPTRIQAATCPPAIEGRDCIGIAQTGSGKTGAYILPCVHWLLMQPKAPYLSILVMVPTRELALQVTQQFIMLGRSINLSVVTLVGGTDMVSQACELSKKPHVIVGTPGRIKDHLTNTKGFQLLKLHALVLDEADKMLDMDYEKELDAILGYLPRERQTLLFSATLNTKIDRLQKASLRDPVMLQVHRKNTTVDTLSQKFIFAPFAQMTPFLHVYLTKETGNHILIFCQSAQLVHKLTLTLRVLGHRALPLMGRMSQENRNVALQKFKESKVRILVCTDVAQRGLDIPHTDVVVNYSLPPNFTDYIHRVGRTARAGSHGKAVNIISQYDVVQLQNFEKQIGHELEEYPIAEEDVNGALQRVEDAEQEAFRQMKEQQQDEKLTKQERAQTSVREAKRTRAEAMSYSDSGRSGTGSFGAMRMRRENEEIYGMTKKDQRKSLWKKRREATKERKSKK